MAELIRLNNVTKRFKDRVILDNISLAIQKGEIFGIVGMSGSGKTTLLNTLIGFLEPEKGDILYFSDKMNRFVSIYKNQQLITSSFGFATQVASFYPKLTVEENLIHFGSLYGLPTKLIKTNAKHLLDLVGLTFAKNLLSQDLSGGMKKKLSLACSLIHKPRVLILDEPTSDLDPLSRKETWEIIKGIHKIGTTVIVASHFLDELESSCDRVALLHDRHVIDVDNPAELVKKYFENEEIHLTTSPGNYERISKMIKQSSGSKIKDIFTQDGSLVIVSHEAENVLHHLLHITEKMDERLVQANITKPSLIEVFESLENK